MFGSQPAFTSTNYTLVDPLFCFPFFFGTSFFLFVTEKDVTRQKRQFRPLTALCYKGTASLTDKNQEVCVFEFLRFLNI